MVNVGFIGVGGMGRFQVNCFTQIRGARIVAAADVSDAARAAFAKRVPGAALYTDHRALLADDRVDAVVVAVPTFLHAKLAIEVMRSGRPVLVEKPMARTVTDARRMLDVAKKTGQLLMVGHCRRYDTDWGKFAQIFRSGMMGKPILWRHVAAGYAPGPPWFMDHKLGGGPIMDGAIHDQDFANMIFGDPKEVVCSAIRLTDYTCVDTATAVVRYASGNQLMLSWSWGVAPSGGGVQDALGTRGSVLFHPGLNGAKLDTKKYGYYRVTNLRTRKSRLLRFPRRDMWVAQGRHFLECVKGKGECITPGTEAIKAVAVSEAILKAGLGGGVCKVKW